MSKTVLVVGSGGREHSLAWKLAQSPQVDKVYCAPGNDGMNNVAETVNINFTDADGLVKFAKDKKIDLTVIGQEAASEAGVVDKFQEFGLKIFGPTKSAAIIETSKAFSKELMDKQNIPTAKFKNFDNFSNALEYVKSRPLPIVIKADGLATGKGVTVAQTYAEAEEAINNIMLKKIFGDSGDRIVIEDFLYGQEVSTHALCDGKTAVMFPSSQDHKQIYDGDKGPNTGGMGVIAPVPWVTKKNLEDTKYKVVLPALEGLKNENKEFKGCLYPGLMVDKDEINVIEFNSRFGDPEAETYMRLIDCDFYQLLENCASGKLKEEDISWKDGFAACVVIASKGYPASSSKGDVITGLDEAEKIEDVVIFHAATAKKDGQTLTAGGRVLNVTATGATLDDALNKAYEAVSLIRFDGMQYRTDIGKRQLA